MKRFRTIAYLFGITLILASGSLAAQTGGTQIPWWVIASGGTTSTSGGLTMSSTIGQPVIGMTNGNGNVLYQGFWYPRPQASSVELLPEDAVAGEAGLRNYPNPFTGSTTIFYTLPERGHLRLSIYDLRGERVRTLADGMAEGGSQEIAWDGRNTRGEEVASGPYLCLIEAELANGKTFTARRMMQRLK